MSVNVLQKSKKTEKNEAMGSPVKVHRKCRLGFFFSPPFQFGLGVLRPNKNLLFSVVLICTACSTHHVLIKHHGGPKCLFFMIKHKTRSTALFNFQSSDENLNVLHHPADFKGPILFSFNPRNFFGKKKASIRVEAGDWSDKFSLDVAGSSGVVQCKANDQTYQVTVLL